MTGILAAAVGGIGRKAMSVVCSPPSVSGVYLSEFGYGATDVASTTISDGVAPYTYSWAKISGTTFTPTPDASSSSISFIFGSPSHLTAVYRLTVTDAIGRTATADLPVTAN